MSMPYAINSNGWRAVGEEFTEADLLPGETLVDEVPQSLIDQIEASRVLAQADAQLYALNRQANAQVTALQARVNTLDYLINQQDEEDPEYIEPAVSEIAELPVIKARLKSWNNYAVKLGRVKTLIGWPTAPSWPIMPEPYTSETSALSLQVV
jgi:hypothetical protein